jgi:hypothetical protein
MTNVVFVIRTTEYNGEGNFFGTQVVSTNITGNVEGQLQSIINSPEYERSRTNSNFAVSYKLTTNPLSQADRQAIIEQGRFLYVIRRRHSATKLMLPLGQPDIYRIVYVEPHAAADRLVISLSTMDTTPAV